MAQTYGIDRQPTQLDYASPTQFKFSIMQLPKVEFFTTAANIPDLSLGDSGIRKLMQRAIINYGVEGTIDAQMRVRYDGDAQDVAQPSSFDLSNPGGIAQYGSSGSTYGSAVYGSSGAPIQRQSIEGSGFLIAVKVDHNSALSPFTLFSYQLVT